jgi:hypothetical protein
MVPTPMYMAHLPPFDSRISFPPEGALNLV